MKEYKIPFRRVYTSTFKDWIKEIVWIFVVIKIFPKAHDFGSDALKEYYNKNPKNMYEQLRFLVDDKYNKRAVK